MLLCLVKGLVLGGQCGTGQGSATGEGKLLLGHGVLAADAGWFVSSWAGGSFSGQPGERQPIIEPGPLLRVI